MRDFELHRRVVGLETPWTVTRVDLSVTEQRVDVCGSSTPPTSGDRPLRAGQSGRSPTTRRPGCGDISIRVSS